MSEDQERGLLTGGACEQDSVVVVFGIHTCRSLWLSCSGFVLVGNSVHVPRFPGKSQLLC